MYYIYGVSGPSLLIESTDSMTSEGQSLNNIFNGKHMHVFSTQVSTVRRAQMLAWCLDVSDQHVKHV